IKTSFCHKTFELMKEFVKFIIRNLEECFKLEPKWLEWAKQLQSIAQAGLTYSKDKYDVERFEMIRDISVEMLSKQTEVDKTIIKELFANESGYATPKVDVRAVVFKDNKILMVKEETDEAWAYQVGGVILVCHQAKLR